MSPGSVGLGTSQMLGSVTRWVPGSIHRRVLGSRLAGLRAPNSVTRWAPASQYPRSDSGTFPSTAEGAAPPHMTYPHKSDSGVTAYAITPELFAEKGGYLLSHLRSTIGTIGLNFSVRNGKRWNPNVITT